MATWAGLNGKDGVQHSDLFDIKLSWGDIIKLIGLDELCFLEIKEYNETKK